jgi:hypothetical protein
MTASLNGDMNDEAWMLAQTGRHRVNQIALINDIARLCCNTG